jgi:hypothetical protein
MCQHLGRDLPITMSKSLRRRRLHRPLHLHNVHQDNHEAILSIIRPFSAMLLHWRDEPAMNPRHHPRTHQNGNLRFLPDRLRDRRHRTHQVFPQGANHRSLQASLPVSPLGKLLSPVSKDETLLNQYRPLLLLDLQRQASVALPTLRMAALCTTSGRRRMILLRCPLSCLRKRQTKPSRVQPLEQ